MQGQNYAQPGTYYVTILTHERECLLGDIVDGEMRLSEIGKIAQECWMDIPNHFPHVSLDEFRVMPNHLHGILVLNMGRTRHEQGKGVLLNAPRSILSNEQGKGVLLNAPTSILSNEQGKGVLLNAPRSILPNEQGKGVLLNAPTRISPQQGSLSVIIRTYKAAAAILSHQAGHNHFRWHRNYHDHIICNAQDLTRIRQYILQNPINWPHDEEDPKNRK